MKEKKTTVPQLRTGQAGKGKICSRCKRFKAYASFNKDKGVPDGYARTCRVCRIRAQSKSKKKYLRQVDALKAKVSCAKCGESRPYMLDFHHNNPAHKVASISDMRDRRTSLAIIKKEIAKCTVLCANHHRELHKLNIPIKQYLKEKE